MLRERKTERQGQSEGRRMDIGKSGTKRKRNMAVSQTASDRREQSGNHRGRAEETILEDDGAKGRIKTCTCSNQSSGNV